VFEIVLRRICVTKQKGKAIEVEMDGIYSTDLQEGDDKYNMYEILVGSHQENGPFKRPRHICEDNIKMYHRRTGYKDLDSPV
jgi:hypothetical protein